jgi:hypothetical protein
MSGIPAEVPPLFILFNRYGASYHTHPAAISKLT